jgi:hypothetical protein
MAPLIECMIFFREKILNCWQVLNNPSAEALIFWRRAVCIGNSFKITTIIMNQLRPQTKKHVKALA